jgi:hypothetical protein
MGRSDLEFLSLAIGIVGTFFLCAAVQVKRPKHILEEAFGISREQLREVHSAVQKRTWLLIGFACNVVALLVLMVSRSAELSDGSVLLSSFSPMESALTVLALGVVLALSLLQGSRIWARRYFRDMVIEVLTENRLPLESNVPLAREIGSLLGVPPDDNDTVPSYMRRLRQRLNLPQNSDAVRSPR